MSRRPRRSDRPVVYRLGLGVNAAQFTLLVVVNALVGGMVGQERTVLPLLAREEFGLSTFSAILTFIVAFGAAKAVTNLVAGALADRFGRKPVLVAGWLVGLPVPLILMFAPSWGWVVAANLLLGVNQGLTWSTTVIMKIDLVGPARRGLAVGLNEASGYLAVAGTAWLTGYIAAHSGLRPEPFYVAVAYAALGLGLSAGFAKETKPYARLEAGSLGVGAAPGRSIREVAVLTTVAEPALSSASQAGLVNNLNDAVAWGLFPLLFAGAGLAPDQIGLLAAIYPVAWGLGQLATGAMSDRVGRKPAIVSGMLLQGGALGVVAASGTVGWWGAALLLLGIGTALVYPTLLAAVADVAHPSWRAGALGVYRFWRDAGFAVGAVVLGLVADGAGLRTAVWATAALTAASGVVVAVRMYETHRPTPPK